MAAVGCAALCACGQPEWRDPARSHGTAALQPEVTAIQEAAATRRGTAKASLVTADPLPALPGWAADLIGKGLRSIYPNIGACVGNTDNLEVRFGNGLGGSKIVGWGWDPMAKAPAPRVVLVDAAFQIVGAGETGGRRADVPKARPDITSEVTGWEAFTRLNAGPLDAWGVLADGKTVCRLGHIEL